MDRTFLEERITKTKALIVAWEDALATAGDESGIQSYTLDTGQGRQVVVRSDISSVNKLLASLYNRLSILEARLNGATVIGVPEC